MNVRRSVRTKTIFKLKLRDVVMLDHSALQGKEPLNAHLDIVMSEQAFNRLGFCLVVPITRSLLGNKLAVEIPRTRNLGFEGFIHPDRIRSLEHSKWIIAEKPGVLPEDLYNEVLSRLATLMDPLQRIFRQA